MTRSRTNKGITVYAKFSKAQQECYAQKTKVPYLRRALALVRRVGHGEDERPLGSLSQRLHRNT